MPCDDAMISNVIRSCCRAASPGSFVTLEATVDRGTVSTFHMHRGMYSTYIQNVAGVEATTSRYPWHSTQRTVIHGLRSTVVVVCNGSGLKRCFAVSLAHRPHTFHNSKSTHQIQHKPIEHCNRCSAADSLQLYSQIKVEDVESFRCMPLFFTRF